ncbi:hypothetical protein EV215_0212 [Hypnocyclicus thermotrophus]|uniref:LPP20 lipoprotein n=1 Tax=Hypnocyclicus thermotrophus TaxID=1627895 RepID=A0AA46E120_9FUSO|nr:hypothetical protein [Hypnocyclicus thermotrophus]TDT72408.1 hypothetical protein EV215_0212 [Hypnocyclicus thermotrophus]
MKKLFFTIILTIFIISCGNNTPKQPVIERDPVVGETKILRTRPVDEPSWTSSVYKAAKDFPEYELFVGISAYSGNERDATKLAEQDAIQKVINYLGTYGENNLKKVFSSSGVDYVDIAEASQEKVTQIAKNFASGIKTLETYLEEGERYSTKQIWEKYFKIYVLYGVEKTDFNSARNRIIQAQKEVLLEKSRTERNAEAKEAMEKAIEELDALTK